MSHGHGVDNCSHLSFGNGKQLDLGESRSRTQFFHSESAARFSSFLDVCMSTHSIQGCSCTLQCGGDGDGNSNSDGDGDSCSNSSSDVDR